MAALYPRDALERWFDEADIKVPHRATISALVDTVFFASLIREEGAPVQIAVAYSPGGSDELAGVVDWSEETEAEPAAAWDVTRFHPIPLTTQGLAKLSRGTTYGTQMIVIGGDASALRIEGIARRVPTTDGGPVLRIAAPRPGVLVFERQFQELLRLEAGHRVEPAFDVIGCDGPVRDAIGSITANRGPRESFNFVSFIEGALRQLIRRMRATEAGAILLLSPTQPDDVVLTQITYRRADPTAFARRVEERNERWFEWINTMITTADETLNADRVQSRESKRQAHEAAEQALDAAIDDLARLSAIDGAVVAGPRLAMYGAGYVIPIGTAVRAEQAIDLGGVRTEPYLQVHGARHRAAFSFAFDRPGAVAFVISEDGPVKCAMRIEDRLVIWPVSISET